MSYVCGLIVRVPATYRLRRDPPPAAVPLELDADQQQVAAHRGGPLLVLAGPGTGKTATLVETVARRVEVGDSPESLLLLTFSRRAAAELRDRLALRLAGRPTVPTAWTFHSFCLALLTEFRARNQPGEPRLRLLSGPDQDAVIRELLRGDLADGREWPEPLNGVLDTRGLTEEVRALIARAQLLGFAAADLFAAAGNRGDWRAVARFYEQYQRSLEDQGFVDYTELVARAAAVANEVDTRTWLRGRFSAVWVDEYQDTDPLQESLLAAIAGDGRELTVVGDPDQAIYSFRGADVDGILRFRERFRTSSGTAAPVIALRTSRRSGRALVAAARAVAARLPVPQGFSHRDLVAKDASGAVRVVTLPTEGAEAEWIADVLRRAHLDDRVAWSDMAVLVRAGVSIPTLRRVLGSMGVPIQVAADELPLATEPSIAPLLLALRCAEDPDQVTAERVRELLLSPLIGADPAELRRLGRILRNRARDASPGTSPPSSAALIGEAVNDPSGLAGLNRHDTTAVRRLSSALSAARAVLHSGGTPAEALWSLWDSSAWKHRLIARAGGRSRDARAADRDLDAVFALFNAVTRAQEQRVGIRVSALLEALAAQQIPAGTLEERGLPREGVRLLTAHRSKGLEWEIVVVAHVQEAGWPDLRPRGSLLNPDELGPDGVQLPRDPRALLADERRLFYVACTRARTRLVVTAVESVADDGDRPSRFVYELGVQVEPALRPARSRTLAGVVASLRCEAVDPAVSPEVRAAAAYRLARLVSARDDSDRPLVPAADPSRWWGLLPRSVGTPYDPTKPTHLSASTLRALAECPLAWFLRHEAGGDTAAGVALGFGRVVHALADLVARDKLPADEDALGQELDRVWGALGYDVPWQQENERRVARRALHRLVEQLARDRGRVLVGSEVAFDSEVDTDAGPVRLRGRMDRLEQDAEGRLVVVDLKTGKGRLSRSEVETDRQLALYQYIVDGQKAAGLPLGARSGGAELWQLRDSDDDLPVVQFQDSLSDQYVGMLSDLASARERILAEDFPATPGKACDRCGFRSCCPAQGDGNMVVS